MLAYLTDLISPDSQWRGSGFNDARQIDRQTLLNYAGHYVSPQPVSLPVIPKTTNPPIAATHRYPGTDENKRKRQ